MPTKMTKTASTKALQGVALEQGQLPPLRDKTAEEKEIVDLLNKNLLNDKRATSKVTSGLEKKPPRKAGKSVAKKPTEPLVAAKLAEPKRNVMPELDVKKESARSRIGTEQSRREKDSMLSDFFKNKKAMK